MNALLIILIGLIVLFVVQAVQYCLAMEHFLNQTDLFKAYQSEHATAMREIIRYRENLEYKEKNLAVARDLFVSDSKKVSPKKEKRK